ncbi:MAG: hypothetical protein HZA91_07400 [Verrucomicrobia bacterium]|nr:hypothetical protein [Verrucomicrobiota bacterium]
MNLWLVYVVGAVLSWGLYGPALHVGQQAVGSRLKALLCVGGAYFALAVLVPVVMMLAKGESFTMTPKGAGYSLLGGALGALGAIAIILAFQAGGKPLVVMPLVFAGAPIINVLISMAMHPPKEAPDWRLYLGFVLASVGAWMVLRFKPA